MEEDYAQVISLLSYCYFILYGNNGFAERSKILAGYKSEK